MMIKVFVKYLGRAMTLCFLLSSIAASAESADSVTAPKGSNQNPGVAAKPIKVFILAGDECVLEEGVVSAEGKPGTLEEFVKSNPAYSFLKGRQGNWITRKDVVLYDAHPQHNNTEAPSRPLRVVTNVKLGPEGGPRMGVDLMLGYVLGEAIEEPVMILRYATRHSIWFQRGSRDLAHAFRPPSSGGGSDLDGGWDVIHFNVGVWDAGYREKGSRYSPESKTTSVEDYEKNLRAIVARLRKTGATLIWGTVTPVWAGTADKPNADEDAYNRVAAKVMKENGVIINDLNAYSRSMGFPKTSNVHSVGNLAPKVTESIRKALADRENNTKPFPRVLLIGDSITGSYQKQVFKDLDGEAKVFKNPGNAECSWNGVARTDEWLNLKRYLLNGQEYMELVDSVHKAMGSELERVCPEYADRGAELAGVVWFQGIDDGSWDAKADAYEENLTNFIRDIRKEFKTPDLPFVIGALAEVGGKMTPNKQKVFDAQMAVGNPTRHPEFKDTVISVDTRPMCFPISECPGGRDRYKGNAASYLKIGEGMGKAMLKLMNQKEN